MTIEPELDELELNPRSDLWEKELARIVGGERETSLIRAGGVVTFIEAFIESSDASVALRSCLYEAIDNITFKWPQVVSKRHNNAMRFLEILAAFLPRGGVSAVFGIYDIASSWHIDPDERIDLLRTLISVLDKYYLQYDNVRTQDVQTEYERMLKAGVGTDVTLASFAVGRLICFDKDYVRELSVAQRIREQRLDINVMVDVILTMCRVIDISSALAELYLLHVSFGHTERKRFEESLHSRSTKVVRDDTGLVSSIHVDGCREVALLRLEYIPRLLDATSAGGMHAYKSLQEEDV